jgi:acylphosphatase
MVARRWVVEGEVQGVGFRWFIHRRAGELGVRGWARNLPDGTVEIVGMAAEPALVLLDEIVRQGPPGAKVIHILTTDIPHEVVDTNSFIIKR